MISVCVFAFHICRVKPKEGNLSVFVSNYFTPRECIGVADTPCPSAICGSQQPCGARRWLGRGLPFCNTARRCACSFTVGQFAEEGSDRVCPASCFVQHCVVIANHGNTACPWSFYIIQRHPEASLLSHTSGAESWFCPLFFFFFPSSHLASSWCGMIRIRKEIILYGFLPVK